MVEDGIEGSAFPIARGTGTRVADAIVEVVKRLGVREAFGVIGGAVAPLADAIARSSLRLVHARHEAGAAFAAVEASLLADRPVVVFTTTGPGLLNALNGIVAGRWDGARLLVLSAVSAPEHRGRLAIQESSAWTLPHDALYAPGAVFDAAAVLHDPRELVELERRLVVGFARPQGYIAHIGVPTSLQSAPSAPSRAMAPITVSPSSVCSSSASAVACLLADDPFAVWVGHGARRAAPLVRALVERCGAHVLSTPRAKGVFPEDHPLYLGVTGAGGHDVPKRLAAVQARRTLVLGTRLGEASSLWDERLVPRDGFVHVDVDPRAFGASFPSAPTLGVTAEVGAFLDALLPHLEEERAPARAIAGPVFPPELPLEARSPVRVGALFAAIQRVIVDESDAVVMAEAGNAFGFANHLLRFDEPERYRTSAAWGSMGHMTTGVLGAALVRGKAVALVGDGAMMMNNELNTAVQERLPAVWVVLNDGGFGIVREGMRRLGLHAPKCEIPRGDFAAFARSMGADGVRVESEDQVDAALRAARDATVPFVVDVRVANEVSPALAGRVASLATPPGTAARRRGKRGGK